MRGRVRRAAFAAILLTTTFIALLVGCGVPERSGVQQLNPPDQLGDTIPTVATTTTSTTIVTASSLPATSTTIVATEPILLFFISGGRLTSISTMLTRPATLSQVIATLQRGLTPLGSVGTGLRSAVPTTRPAIAIADSGETTGTAVVDLPSAFFDAIAQADQRLAIAQIVLTLLARPGIGTVTFTADGQARGVPKGDGTTSAPREPLTRGDFLALTNGPTTPTVETSTSTTSTTTTAPGPSGASTTTQTTAEPTTAASPSTVATTVAPPTTGPG